MGFLLDINVLIARINIRHQHHLIGVDWEKRYHKADLYVCPLSENGFVRIYGHPN